MESFEWSTEFETGIKIIDKQHRELFVRMDKLTLALYKGRAKQELDSLYEFLESYVIEHFDMEEKLMLQYRYGEYPRHKEEHRLFRVTLSGLKREFVRSGSDNYLAINTEKMLSTWWKKHILGSDMLFVPVITDKYNRGE